MEECGGMPRMEAELAIFQVQGMTCASCTGAVERALRAVPGVSDASVNLLMKRAEVKHQGVEVQKLQEAVEDIGFDCEVIQELKPQVTSDKLMVGSFKVGGMTCAACVGAVERAVLAVMGVKSADVSLTLKLAKVTYTSKADEIVSAIESIGFEGELLTEAAATSGDRPSELPVAPLRSAAELRKAASAIYGVRGVVVHKDESSARLLYDPIEVGARSLLEKLDGVCRYHVEVAEDPTAATLRLLHSRLCLSVAPTLMIVLLAEGFLPEAWDDSVLPSGFLYVLCLSAFVQFYCGWSFHSAAFSAALHGASTMNTLVSLSTTVSFLYGLLGGLCHVLGSPLFSLGMASMFCETSAVLITVLLAGRMLEARAKSHTTALVREISAKRPEFARLLEKEEESSVRYDLIQLGDLLRVLPGEQVPVDGEVVTDSTAYCDESLLTGEPRAVRKQKGSQVVGGSTSVQGGFVMKAMSAGNSTTLARILQLVEDAQTRRPKVQRSVDLLASYFTPVVLASAVLTFCVWSFQAQNLEDFTFSITRAVSVLVIACPCSFGLATPTAIMVATGLAAKHGCLVKDSVVWEKMGSLKVAVLDKTGTITKGKPQVVAVSLLPGAAASSAAGPVAKASALLRAVESTSEHPLAEALRLWAESVCETVAAAEDFQHQPGQGVSCRVPGLGLVRCGRPSGALPEEWQQRQAEGCVVVALDVAEQPCALLALRDELQECSQQAVSDLHRAGFQVWLCTGDEPRTAHAVASKVGIAKERVMAACSPQAKAKLVEELSKKAPVLMVGDGLNDAAALASASVGVAIGTGAQVTMDSAQVILMGSRLSDLILFLDLSKATMRTIYRNFAWALSFNFLGLPLAAGLGAPWGLWLPPTFCGAAMACSSLLVVTSSLMLGLCHR
ncbi:unnamed protein product [Effrenium voratum]|nr:unnamed protein product [Effrenium voratum]